MTRETQALARPRTNRVLMLFTKRCFRELDWLISESRYAVYGIGVAIKPTNSGSITDTARVYPKKGITRDIALFTSLVYFVICFIIICVRVIE